MYNFVLISSQCRNPRYVVKLIVSIIITDYEETMFLV